MSATSKPHDTEEAVRDVLNSLEEGDEVTIEAVGDGHTERINREVFLVEDTYLMVGDPVHGLSRLVYPRSLTMEEAAKDADELGEDVMDVTKVWKWVEEDDA